MNKKAQLDNPVLIIAVIIIALVILGPIFLKIIRSIQSPVSASLGNITTGGVVAQANFDYVMNAGIRFWDKVLTAAFVLAVLLLIVSSFLVDAHPFFIGLYILMDMFLILFAPGIVGAFDAIYDSPQFAQEVALLPFINVLRTHYAEFLVGLMVLTGVIIYGKYALFGGGQKRR